MNLITCVCCGHIVSNSADSCPGCNKNRKSFEGVSCVYCKKRISYDAAVLFDADRYACEQCTAERFTPPSNWKCADCGTELPNLSYKEVLLPHYFSCGNCGSRFPFGGFQGHCGICGCMIVKFQKTYEFKPLYGSDKATAHHFCQCPRSKSGCMSLLACIACGLACVLAIVFR